MFGMIIVGAGVLGALLTYAGSLAHHTHQARQIRALHESVRAYEARQAPSSLGGASAAPVSGGPAGEPRRP